MAAVTPEYQFVTKGKTNTNDNINMIKTLLVEVASTVDNGDTIQIDLSSRGITTFLAVEGWIHSTADSVLVLEAPTTAVSAGVLTITVGGATPNKQRAYRVYGV